MDFYLTTSASTFPCFQINWKRIKECVCIACSGLMIKSLLQIVNRFDGIDRQEVDNLQQVSKDQTVSDFHSILYSQLI